MFYSILINFFSLPPWITEVIKVFIKIKTQKFLHCWTASFTWSKLQVKSRERGTWWYLNLVAFKSRYLLSSYSDTFFILAFSITFPSESNVAITNDNLRKTDRLVMTIILAVSMIMVMLIATIIVMMSGAAFFQIQLPFASLACKPTVTFKTLSSLLNFLFPNVNVNLLKKIEKQKKFLSFGNFSLSLIQIMHDSWLSFFFSFLLFYLFIFNTFIFGFESKTLIFYLYLSKYLSVPSEKWKH